MTEQITVTIPTEVNQALNDLSEKQGVPANEIIGVALKHHLFLQEFRSLRECMSAKAQDQGIVTDQDVFDRIS